MPQRLFLRLRAASRPMPGLRFTVIAMKLLEALSLPLPGSWMWDMGMSPSNPGALAALLPTAFFREKDSSYYITFGFYDETDAGTVGPIFFNTALYCLARNSTSTERNFTEVPVAGIPPRGRAFSTGVSCC